MYQHRYQIGKILFRKKIKVASNILLKKNQKKLNFMMNNLTIIKKLLRNINNKFCKKNQGKTKINKKVKQYQKICFCIKST